MDGIFHRPALGVTLYKPPPVGEPKPAVNDEDTRGILALVGLNIDGAAECLALIEEVRFAHGTPAEVREALGRPVRALRMSLDVAKQWVDRGLGR